MILVIGFMVRYDHLGVTSVIRALSLDGNCYETMLHFFRSKAYQLSAIRQRWCEVVRDSGLLYQVDGKTVLIGDGVKQSKEAYHMQKTFRQDFINRKAIKNTGQLPMYLIENHHEGIVSREKYDAVQAEMARRNAAKSPSKNAVTG
ncbi:MAG: recombinase family protein, partial [Clostridia bacterium]|nr:recombinase family protein [Clostridia bacterium]